MHIVNTVVSPLRDLVILQRGNRFFFGFSLHGTSEMTLEPTPYACQSDAEIVAGMEQSMDEAWVMEEHGEDLAAQDLDMVAARR